MPSVRGIVKYTVLAGKSSDAMGGAQEKGPILTVLQFDFLWNHRKLDDGERTILEMRVQAAACRARSSRSAQCINKSFLAWFC